jgi:carbon-monoxide dehydrogenase small subunit
MATARQVRLTVNGVTHEALVEPRLTRVDFLRGQLGSRHARQRARRMQRVHHPRRQQAVRSPRLAVQADGADVLTVEGLAREGRLHPIQEAVLEGHGLQCGFCTPGFLMTLCELLHDNPDPSDEEVKDALGGNLCRCTGYQSILESVRLAVTKMKDAQAGGAP